VAICHAYNERTKRTRRQRNHRDDGGEDGRLATEDIWTCTHGAGKREETRTVAKRDEENRVEAREKEKGGGRDSEKRVNVSDERAPRCVSVGRSVAMPVVSLVN